MDEVGLSFYPHLELSVPWLPWVGLPRALLSARVPTTSRALVALPNAQVLSELSP